MIQWLRLCAFIAKCTGSIPGHGAKIPQAAQHGQEKERENMDKKQKIIHFKISQWNIAGKFWKEVEINKINITEMKAKHEVAKGRTDIEENRTRETGE